METLLADCVQRSLDQFMISNAIFMCERLCAEFPSEVNSQLLARCFLSNNQPYSAYCILKGYQTAQSRYLFAISCFHLELFSEAEAALSPTEENKGQVPNGAAGHYLLGLIYRHNGRMKSSVEHFRKALLCDPLFWAAYEELCRLVSAEEPDVTFGEKALQKLQNLYQEQTSSYLHIASGNLFSASDRALKDVNPRHSKHIPRDISNNEHRNYCGSAILPGSVSSHVYGCHANDTVCRTPSPVTTLLSDDGPPPLERNLYRRTYESSFVSTSGISRRKLILEDKPVEVGLWGLFSEEGLRRSARLAANRSTTNLHVAVRGARSSASSPSSTSSLNSVIGREDSETTEQEYGPPDGARSYYTANSSSKSLCTAGVANSDSGEKLGCSISNPSGIISGATATLNLLKIIGEGLRFSYMYKCHDALSAYRKLSQQQYNTRWVLVQVGKAFSELRDYFNADWSFNLSHRIAPYNLEGMETYSIVLYHLKDEMKCSYLAQELISIDRLAPESWCAAGNCYALQKDHETALKMFQRAIQLKPRFAYAHTLCGHEQTAMEDYENAEKSYQRALRIDSRHYNAWYGLGTIYLHQERFDFAEHHLRQALHINPCSLIMCYCAMALHGSKRSKEALQMLEDAIKRDAKNPMFHYHKANVLYCLGMYDEAVGILEGLKDHYPQESSVHALLGKIHRKRKSYGKAIFHFGVALDLRPPISDLATIKAAMENMHLPDEMENDL